MKARKINGDEFVWPDYSPHAARFWAWYRGGPTVHHQKHNGPAVTVDTWQDFWNTLTTGVNEDGRRRENH